MEPSFEDRVLVCVDRGISTLGESSKHAVYWHMKHGYGLSREEIPNRPLEFIGFLEKMFGQGARTLERLIVREIALAFDVSGEARTFAETIAAAKEGNQ